MRLDVAAVGVEGETVNHNIAGEGASFAALDVAAGGGGLAGCLGTEGLARGQRSHGGTKKVEPVSS